MTALLEVYPFVNPTKELPTHDSPMSAVNPRSRKRSSSINRRLYSPAFALSIPKKTSPWQQLGQGDVTTYLKAANAQAV